MIKARLDYSFQSPNEKLNEKFSENYKIFNLKKDFSQFCRGKLNRFDQIIKLMIFI